MTHPAPGTTGALGEAAPVPGESLELEVGAVAHGGHCVARYAGRVVFVRHALPGERVRAVVTEQRRSYLRADTVQVLSAAPRRVAPPCPYAGPGRCGGCDWQHAEPAAQRDLKATVVRELLVRIGRLSEDEVDALGFAVTELPGGALGWRTRVRYSVDDSGRAGFHKHRSHEVVPVDECLIAHPAVRALPVTGRRWPAGAAVTAVAASASPTDGDHAVLVDPDGRPPRLVDGAEQLVERVTGREFRVPADGFWQVHPAAPDAFVAAVLDLLRPAPGERALDLYGGAGLFAAALAERVGDAGRVTLIESGTDAAAAARRNLADLPAARVVAARVERVLARVLAAEPVELVVLDPPRAGAGGDVVRLLAAARPRAIGYVACDPAALARDVRVFVDEGWRLAALRGYDAYPMTHHVECVALLLPR